MFDQMKMHAEQLGYVIQGKETVCLSLCVAATMGDNLAVAQLSDLLEEAGMESPYPNQWPTMGECFKASIKATRKTYRKFSREKKKTFRDGARAAGCYRVCHNAR